MIAPGTAHHGTRSVQGAERSKPPPVARGLRMVAPARRRAVHRGAIGARNQVAVRVDGDRNRGVPELLLHVDNRLALLQQRRPAMSIALRYASALTRLLQVFSGSGRAARAPTAHRLLISLSVRVECARPSAGSRTSLPTGPLFDPAPCLRRPTSGSERRCIRARR